MSPEAAIAMVGLYFRTRHSASPLVGPPWGHTMENHLLKWVAVRSMLPAGWAWGSDLVAFSHASATRSPLLLYGSFFERLVRALGCRDRLHAALHIPQNNGSARQLTEAFDYFLVNLVAAFDITARVAHLSLGLPVDKRKTAGWQRGWRKSVREACPELAALYADGTIHSQRLAAVRILRNTVHGEGLNSTLRIGAGRDPHTLVALPEDDAEELVDIFGSLSSGQDWGVRDFGHAGSFIDAGMFVESILPGILETLNLTLAGTPTNHLSTQGDSMLPERPEDPRFGPGSTQRAQLLLGLPRAEGS